MKLTCPYCDEDIELSESLAAPLVEELKKKHEVEVLAMQDGFASSVEIAVAQATKKVADTERAKAQRAASEDLRLKNEELTDLEEQLATKNKKLAVAQKDQAEAVRAKRELADKERELQLTIDKAISEGSAAVRIAARAEVEDQIGLKIKEREETIASMQRTIADLNKKAEQGSQQLQGEVQEIQMEDLLREQFPQDLIEAVPKGVHGGDIVQRVLSTTGRECGVILWESKRTKSWSTSWLSKLRGDQRAAKADVAALATTTMPKGVNSFGLIDGVWVCSVPTVASLAVVLRQGLIDVAMARVASEGMQSKAEQIYEYFTGPQFKARIGAMVESFTAMAEDLDKEKRAITRTWAKRAEQINRVMQATAGMSGDLQGIAGGELQEIEGLDVAELGA